MSPLALVTGAAHRLGKSFALSLAGQGYDILLHYHSAEDEAFETKAEIESMGRRVFLSSADLTRDEGIDSLLADLMNIPSQLGVLVNSASVMQRSDIHSLSLDDWDAAFALNLRAPFVLSKTLSKKMSQGGLIVNITDVGAQKAWSGFPAYTVSKAALESLTRVLARALAPGIRVNAIAPGLVLSNLSPEEWQKRVDHLPLRRPASVDEISSALEFLLKNEYITGQTIVVDGGYSLV